MTTALQQQTFALDARYNALRGLKASNFRTLYIRRRSQLLRETERSADQWTQYLHIRATLLQQRYGSYNSDSSCSSQSLLRTVDELHDTHSVGPQEVHLVPTRQAQASRAMVGDNSMAENYAFVGVHHIFDQHTQAVTMVKFANNDRSKLCCGSLDCNLSICDVTSNPPEVIAVLKGHTGAISGFDWSVDNDLIVSTSLDSTLRVWSVKNLNCIRTFRDPNNAQLFCCLFHPRNNNVLIIGNGRGELRIANVSLGRFMKNICKIGGQVLSLTSDANGKIFWAGNDNGEIVSVFCEVKGGLCKTRKISLGTSCAITSLSYKAWITREARDPLLLVNATNNSLCLFSVIDSEGGLQLRRMFQNRHKKQFVRSTFCPIMSFRQGSCVVTGSEDGSVYFIDVEKIGNKSVLNTLQGHSSSVLGISFNYNESLLATSDLQGLVIIWRRGNTL